MLTSNSGNQYLRPEYLSPLPTTLDAKKSPLALLAQTCSAIGSDPPSASAKSLLNSAASAGQLPLDQLKKKSALANGSGSSQEKSSSSSGGSSKGSPGPRKNSGRRTTSPEAAKDETSNQSGDGEKSETSINGNNNNNNGKGRVKTPGSKGATPNPPHGSPTLTLSNGVEKTAVSNNSSAETKTETPTITTSSVGSRLYKPPPPVLSPPRGPITMPGFYPGVPGLPSHMPPNSVGTGIPPYLHSYARLKAAASTGASDHHNLLHPSLSMCRDPYCTGCQLGGHLSSKGPPCPAGCSQCDYHKHLNALSGSASFPFFPPFHPLPPSDPANFSVHQQMAQPYVCSWTVGESYCGKRFSSSEELLQHLRSHTSVTGVPVSNGSSPPDLFPYLGHSHLLSPSVSLQHLNLSMNMNLSRSYPTPPLSPLSSSAARFHPYSKPPGGPMGSAGLSLSLGSFHPLSPFYPYSHLYGQGRLPPNSLHP